MEVPVGGCSAFNPDWHWSFPTAFDSTSAGPGKLPASTDGLSLLVEGPSLPIVILLPIVSLPALVALGTDESARAAVAVTASGSGGKGGRSAVVGAGSGGMPGVWRTSGIVSAAVELDSFRLRLNELDVAIAQLVDRDLPDATVL